jgi:Amt family ammonium transporter
MAGFNARRPLVAAVSAACTFAASTALAAQGAAEATASSGDTAWVLVASALVLFMSLPGLALFYGGLVRARNVLSVLMHCFVICCIVSVLWAIGAYSLAFDSGNGLLGGLSRAFLANLAPVKDGTTLPEVAFVLYQMTFAVITPALIIGAFPERVTFRFVILFTPLWLLLVYVPAAHWVWGGGWLAKQGVLDFAGGIVVHTTAGISALVTALMIGKRKGFPNHLVPPHSPTMTMAGAGMLWVGWFGFNGGSALAANIQAGSAIVTTQLAASVAALAWIAIEWIRSGKPTSIGIVTGAVAGLATITPGAGYVAPMGGLVIGLFAGLVCYTATLLMKQHFKVDDSLDVFAVHGVGGMLGSLLLAFFGVSALGGSGFNGGWLHQLGVQILGVGVVALWSGALTFLIVKLIGLAVPLRVSAEAEYDGLDLSTHGERAYDYT